MYSLRLLLQVLFLLLLLCLLLLLLLILLFGFSVSRCLLWFCRWFLLLFLLLLFSVKGTALCNFDAATPSELKPVTRYLERS